MENKELHDKQQYIFCPYEELKLKLPFTNTFNSAYYKLISNHWSEKLAQIKNDFTTGNIDANTKQLMENKAKIARGLLSSQRRRQVFDNYKEQDLEIAWNKIKEFDKLEDLEKSAECMVHRLSRVPKPTKQVVIDHCKSTLAAIIFVHGNAKFEKWITDAAPLTQIGKESAPKKDQIASSLSSSALQNNSPPNLNVALEHNPTKIPKEVDILVKMLNIHTEIEKILHHAQSTVEQDRINKWKETLDNYKNVLKASEMAMHSALKACANTKKEETLKETEQPRNYSINGNKRTKLA